MQNRLGRHLAALFIAAVLALGAWPACDSASSGCKDDYDCPNHQVCLGGQCDEPVCRSNDECTVAGEVCRQHVCGPPSSEAQ